MSDNILETPLTISSILCIHMQLKFCSTHFSIQGKQLLVWNIIGLKFVFVKIKLKRCPFRCQRKHNLLKCPKNSRFLQLEKDPLQTATNKLKLNPRKKGGAKGTHSSK